MSRTAKPIAGSPTAPKKVRASKSKVVEVIEPVVVAPQPVPIIAVSIPLPRKLDPTIQPGRRVVVHHIKDPRKRKEEVVFWGIVRNVTTLGAYCYSLKDNQSPDAAEWFPFKSPRSRMTLAYPNERS